MKRSTLVRTVGRCPPISSRLGSGLLGVQAHAAQFYRLDEVVTVDQFMSAIDVGIAAEREIFTVVGGPANIEGGETGPVVEMVLGAHVRDFRHRSPIGAGWPPSRWMAERGRSTSIWAKAGT